MPFRLCDQSPRNSGIYSCDHCRICLVHRLEHGRLHDEVLKVRVKVADHFFGEVVVQVALGAAERANEATDVTCRAVADGGADELQRRGPAFGSAREIVEHVRLEGVVINVTEEPLCFWLAESKIVGCELGQFAQGPQPGNPYRRLAPAGEDERDSLWGLRQQLAD